MRAVRALGVHKQSTWPGKETRRGAWGKPKEKSREKWEVVNMNKITSMNYKRKTNVVKEARFFSAFRQPTGFPQRTFRRFAS